ncbi:delta endotoxin C-terminal domain-containing protein, partial [Cobetia marina]
MTFEDAQDRLSVFERFERPFVFDHLPTPLSGKLKMMIEALDERGEVLPGSGEQFGFEVESPDVVAEEVSDQEVSDQEVSDQEDTPQAAQALLTSSDEPAAGTGPALHAEPAPLATAALIAPESFTTLRIEAEDLSDDDGDGNASSIGGAGIEVVTGGDNPSNTANASGTAYVDFGGATGETLTFTFSVTEAGEYELALGYALSQNGDGSDRNRPLRLDVNGELQDRMFDLPSTTLTGDATDFSEFGERTIRVQLQAGENTVSFTSNGASGPNVDYLEVRAPDPDVFVIQGEDLDIGPTSDVADAGTNRVVTLDNIASFTNGRETFRVGAEGASYLDWASGNAEAYGDFTFEVATAGTYSVTVTYASSSARPIGLFLIDEGTPGQIGTFQFAAVTAPNYYPDDVDDVPADNQPGNGGPSAWEGWSTETLEITLAAGSNTLRLGGATNGPNIDKIEVALLEADAVEPVDPVIAPVVIAPVVMQAEDAVLGAGNGAATVVRDAANPEAGGFAGLRPDFSGTGYVDFGSAPGDSLAFTVNVAEAGDYDLNFRYASNGARPLALSINDGESSELAFVGTDPNAGNVDPEGFDVWSYHTLTTSLEVGDNTVTLTIPDGRSNGPNVDRLEVTTAGTGPVGDVVADADASVLTFTAVDPLLNGATVGEAGFSVSGLDADITFVGVTFDEGITVQEVVPNPDGSFTLDLSGFADGDLSVTLIAMDAFGNRAEQSLALTLDTTADERGDLALEGPQDAIEADDSASVVFGVAGIDDGSTLEISFDGGVTRQSVVSDGDTLTVDLSTQAPGDVIVTLIVTDAAGNEASVAEAVTLAVVGSVSLDVTFDDATISAYNTTQDNPSVGTGAVVEDDGGTLTLNDNVWKRAALPEDYTITSGSILTLDVAISDSPVPEIVAIGFDADSNPFNGGNSVYQLGGSQTQGGFVDLRGQGIDNGDGTLRFTIDLSAHAGITLDSLVFVNDDDVGA